LSGRMSRLAPINLSPTEFDKRVADACYHWADPKVEPIFQVVTWLADEKIMVAGAGTCLARNACSILRRIGKATRRSNAVFSSHCGCRASCFQIAFRPRTARPHSGARGAQGYPEVRQSIRFSFPSRHAVHVGALAGALTRMRPQSFWSIWTAAFILAGTRVVLLAHHVTDVVAGLLLGLAINSAVDRIALVALRRKLYPSQMQWPRPLPSATFHLSMILRLCGLPRDMPHPGQMCFKLPKGTTMRDRH
jgi:membrane-associated phospholipid phosphatase